MSKQPKNLLKKYEDWWTLYCSCGDPGHFIDFYKDNDIDGVWIMTCNTEIYNTKCFDNWFIDKLYEFWWRIKHAFKLLFSGKLETVFEMVLDGNNLDGFRKCCEKVLTKK